MAASTARLGFFLATQAHGLEGILLASTGGDAPRPSVAVPSGEVGLPVRSTARALVRGLRLGHTLPPLQLAQRPVNRRVMFGQPGQRSQPIITIRLALSGPPVGLP
jgi:hypothetical protein